MNVYDFGAFKQPTGWIAYYRRVHDGQNSVLRHKGDDILFATELEALKAARVAFLDYVNLPISGCSAPKVNKFKVAEEQIRQAFSSGEKRSA